MTRERRSLWGSISTSRKVNAVSIYAALLYTWSIPHFDDEGFLDGEIEQLKAKIVPLRDEFGKKTLARCVKELSAIGLWRVFSDLDRIIIYDPSFETHQIFKAIKKLPSKLRGYIWTHNPDWLTTPPQRVDHSTLDLPQGKLSEVKGSEVKGSTEAKPFLSLSDEEKKKKEREEIDRKITEYKNKEVKSW